MEEFSDYKHLNIKKVIMVVAIGLLLIVSIIVFAVSRKIEKSAETEDTNSIANQNAVAQNEEAKTQIFTDIDNTVSLELPTKYKLEQSHNSEYLIKLTSEANMYIYLSKMEKIENRPLSSIARADKLSYIESYNANSNVSDIKELNVNGNLAYTYSFHYLDENLNKAFCIQVVLLELEDAIYIFDIDFPLDNLSMYTSLTTEVLEKFVKY